MRTKIQILWPWELPEKIEGITVVIDVLSATSNIAWFLSHNVKELVIVNERNVHVALERYKGALLIGESFDVSLKQYFSASNSPADISRVDVAYKTVLYMTYNGSAVIEEALRRGKGEVITGSFTNFEGILSCLKSFYLAGVTLIPSGCVDVPQLIPDKKSREDWLCAELLQNKISGKDADSEKYIEEAQMFIDSHYKYDKVKKKVDIKMVTSLNANPKVAVCRRLDDGFIYIETLPLVLK